MTIEDIQHRSTAWNNTDKRAIWGTGAAIALIIAAAVVLVVVLNADHSSDAGSRSSPTWFVMPLQTNLVERTTGLSAQTVYIANGSVDPDAATFTYTSGRGLAWTSKPETMVVLPASIGVLGVVYSYTFYFQLTAYSLGTPYTSIVSSADYISSSGFLAGVWNTSQYHGDGITANTLAFFQGAQDVGNDTDSSAEEAYNAGSCLGSGLRPAQLNTWTHIAVVNTAGQITYDGYDTPDFSTYLYVNGTLSCAQTAETLMLWEGSPSIQLGYLEGASNVMAGFAQCFTWASFALNATQVLESMTLCD
jgi:hypothetical protein